MAALQSIRKHGGLLIAVIGLALFAFIAEEFVRSLSTTSALNKQEVASVCGEEIKIQDYQELESAAMEFAKFQNQTDNLTEQQIQQAKNEAWGFYQQSKVVENEAEKLGLAVSKAELQHAIVDGSSQALQTFSQVCLGSPQYNYQIIQETLKQCEDLKAKGGEQMEVAARILKVWKYVEAQTRFEILNNKYMCMIVGSQIGSPTSAKSLFDERNTNTTLAVASLPTTAIADKDAKATDKDVEDVYNYYKEVFALNQETRDIKYIDVQVTASAADRQNLNKKMNDAYTQLVAGEDVNVAMAGLNSNTRFADMYLSKTAYPRDVQSHLDSISVGSVHPVYYEAGDNTLNLIKYIGSQERPDSVLVRYIGVGGKDEKEIATRADSIFNALNGGAKYKDVASKYGQPSDSVWQNIPNMIERDQQGRPNRYEDISAASDDFKAFIEAISTKAVGFHKVEIGGNTLVMQILDRKKMTTKYNVAVIKVPVDFSTDTYNKMVNDLNAFISQNKTIEDMEKNAAKAGYIVNERNNFSASEGAVGNISGTENAIRWIFDEADEASISPLYTDCGQNRDHLLLVAVTGINDGKYIPLTNKFVKESLTPIANAQVKSEAAYKKLSGVKSLAEAQKKGATIDTLTNVSMANRMIDPVISGAASHMKKGEVATVKALSGAYTIKVEAKEQGQEKYNAEQAKAQDAYMNRQRLMQEMQQVLFTNAKIVDNRYRF